MCKRREARLLKIRLFGRSVLIGWNGEKTLRYGIHRERLFTAIGVWPLLIGIGRKGGEVL